MLVSQFFHSGGQMTEEDCINNVGLDLVKKEGENQLTNIALSNLIPICQGKSQSQ